MTDHEHLEPSRQVITYRRQTAMVESRMPPVLDERGPTSQGMPLSAYLYVLWRRRWTVLGAIVILTSIAAVLSFRMTPIYEATARLEIEPETPQFQSSSDVYQKTGRDDVFLQTEIQVLKSESLAWEIIEQLNLARALGGSVEKVVGEDPDKRKVELIGSFGATSKLRRF